MSVDFIPEIPGSQLQLQVAWGADLTDTSQASWSWTDITEDVRYEGDGIRYSWGRPDEASGITPARLTCTLDNSAAAYSKGSGSPNYPNVRRNTPVRLQLDLDDGNGMVTAWQGFAVGFTPSWEAAGRIPIVTLEATGSWRRILQRKDPLASALYRYHTIGRAYDQVATDYWPLEEGKGATAAASPIGSSPGQFVPVESGGELFGQVSWGADTDLPAASAATVLEPLGTLVFTARPALYAPAAGVHTAATWSMRISSESGAFVRWYQDSTTRVGITLVFYTDGTGEVYRTTGSDPNGTLLDTFTLGQPYEWDGVWRHYALTLDNPSDGTTGTSVVLAVDGVEVASAFLTTGTTLWRLKPLRLEVAVPAADAGIGLAHVAMWSDAARVLGTGAPLNRWLAAHRAHDGESAQARFIRLCLEQGTGASVSDLAGSASTTLMGPQLPAALSALLEECVAADMALLYDGSPYSDLRLVPRSDRENAPTVLTLDAGDSTGLAPVDDDQRTLNRATVKTAKGAQATVEDTTGAMGTEAIGIYEGGADVNLSNGGDALPMAQWLVYLGTIEGYRYPTVALDLRATPTLAGAVLALEPSNGVTLADPASVFAGIAGEDVALIVEGMSATVSPHRWTVELQCSLAEGWAIGTLAAETGDTGSDSIRLSSGVSVLTSFAMAGATSMTVSTTPGAPLWTTAADDYPLYLLADGVRVRATACSGTSSIQTFTVDPLPRTLFISARVDVWDPPVLGL